MVGVITSSCCSGQGSGGADIKPYFIHNGWFWRKNIEKGNANYEEIEVGDNVNNGVLPDKTVFSGEWLGDLTGGGLLDLDNYNSPGDYQQNN